MKRIRIVGLCLIAAWAMSTVAATSAAAALPEFSGPFPKAVTLKAKASSVLETVSKVKVKCTAATGTGEATEPKTLSLSLTLTGCKKGIVACTDMTISSNIGSSFLGYIDALKHEVGIGFLGGAPSGQMLGFTECGATKVAIQASGHGQIGKVTPVNKTVVSGNHFTLKFSQKEGKPKYTQLEGGETEGWSCGPFSGEEECAFASSDEMAFTEEVRIKA